MKESKNLAIRRRATQSRQSANMLAEKILARRLKVVLTSRRATQSRQSANMLAGKLRARRLKVVLTRSH